MNADEFLKIVRKYSNFEELNPEILREFIDKIEVVRMTGFEPAKTCVHMDLNHTRLPTPPHPQTNKILITNK